MMLLRKFKSFIVYPLFAALVVFSGCSGGGGGDGAGAAACGELGIKVTGGTQCDYRRSPVIAVVAVNVINGEYHPRGICTGTLVTVNDILTAAHCVMDRGADGFFVIANQRVIPVASGAIHPFYSGRVGSPFDVAMLTIDEVLDISPVPILVSDRIVIGESVSIYGYGSDEEGRTLADLGLEALKAGKMVIEGIGGGLFAAAFDRLGSAICQGDSGGPVVQVIDGVPSIVGVTSFTIAGCQEGSISGFVDMQITGNVNFVRNYAPDVTFR